MEMLEMPDDLKHCSKIINELNKYMAKIKMQIQDLENKLGNLNKNQQKDFKEEKSWKLKTLPYIKKMQVNNRIYYK